MNSKDKLRKVIQEHLQSLTTATYPYFDSLLNTTDGYQKAEDLIIRYAIKNRVSVGAAIAQLEAEMQ